MSRICTQCHKTRADSQFWAGTVCRKCQVIGAVGKADRAGKSLYSDRPQKFMNATRKRRADMKQRTIPSDLYFVRKKLKDRPPGMHADHIIPLNGYTDEGHRVSGLHVSWNIAYLTPEENDRKGNGMRPGIDHTIYRGAPGYAEAHHKDADNEKGQASAKSETSEVREADLA